MKHRGDTQDFDRDLKTIERLLLEMGGLVEAQMRDAMTALISRDTALGTAVRVNDKRIDTLEQSINERTVRLLGLRPANVDDLRLIIAIMKVSTSLERIGDYAKNIAKRLTVLTQTTPIGTSEKTLKRMSALVQNMVADVLDSFIRRDVALADDVRARDEDVDLMNNTLFQELLAHMTGNPHNITACMHLLFIAKNIERAGDHTTAIAEQVHYLVSGALPAENRKKGDVTSTMSLDVSRGA